MKILKKWVFLYKLNNVLSMYQLIEVRQHYYHWTIMVVVRMLDMYQHFYWLNTKTWFYIAIHVNKKHTWGLIYIMFLNNSLDLGSFNNDLIANMRILVVCCGLKSHTNKLAPWVLKNIAIF